MSEPARELFPGETVENTEIQPMRWHGFLVKCMLWIAAAYHAFQAAWILSGRIYYEAAARDAIYASMPALRIADYTYAAVLLAAAVLQLSARHFLARHKCGGIIRLKAAYILLAAVQAAHLLARFVISGLPPLNPAAIAWIAAYLMLLRINVLYYRRRGKLFE